MQRPEPAAILRFVIPTLIVVGVFALLTNHAKDPLSNTDTYFHLRFGHEFLTGNWSLTQSRERDHVRHQRLGADPMAARRS